MDFSQFFNQDESNKSGSSGIDMSLVEALLKEAGDNYKKEAEESPEERLDKAMDVFDEAYGGPDEFVENVWFKFMKEFGTASMEGIANHITTARNGQPMSASVVAGALALLGEEIMIKMLQSNGDMKGAEMLLRAMAAAQTIDRMLPNDTTTDDIIISMALLSLANKRLCEVTVHSEALRLLETEGEAFKPLEEDE